MSRAYIVCYNCNSYYCYCSDQNLEVYYAWGFEPDTPRIYPDNILYSTLEVDEDGYVEFWFDTFEEFEIDIPTIYVILRIHPLAEDILNIYQSNNW